MRVYILNFKGIGLRLICFVPNAIINSNDPRTLDRVSLFDCRVPIVCPAGGLLRDSNWRRHKCLMAVLEVLEIDFKHYNATDYTK